MEQHHHGDSVCESEPKHKSIEDQRQSHQAGGANESFVVASAFPFKPSNCTKQKRHPQKPIAARNLGKVHRHLKIAGNCLTFLLVE